MTKVYIIRHAEAEGNLYRRIHGHYNSNLTKLGMKQLDALEARFSGVHIDKVYSSDLSRTVMTSTAITRSRGMTAETSPLFREVNMGVWEDLEWGNAEKYNQEQLIAFSVDPIKWAIDGCENFAYTQERMLRAMFHAAAQNDGKTIAIFSHGAAIRALTAKLTGVPSDKITDVGFCDNTAVMTLSVEGDSVDIISEGDSSHITDGCSRFTRQCWHKNKTGLDASNLRMERSTEADMKLICDWYGSAIKAPERGGVFTAYRGEEKIGATLVDTGSLAKTGSGLMSCCLKPEYRGSRFLPQLIGKAVSVSRSAGLSRLEANASENEIREKFIHLGFENNEYTHNENIMMDISIHHLV